MNIVIHNRITLSRIELFINSSMEISAKWKDCYSISNKMMLENEKKFGICIYMYINRRWMKVDNEIIHHIRCQSTLFMPIIKKKLLTVGQCHVIV